jgi:hypothetical protein
MAVPKHPPASAPAPASDLLAGRGEGRDRAFRHAGGTHPRDEQDASTAGLYHSDLWNRDYPKLQVFSIRELLEGRRHELPPLRQPTYQQAERHLGAAGQQEQPL